MSPWRRGIGLCCTLPLAIGLTADAPRGDILELRLRGTKRNRDALGAVVRLTVGKRTLVRQVEAATGYLSQSSKTLHFGLGHATKIDGGEIRWPSGIVERIGPLEIDRRQDLVEPSR